MKKNIPYIVFLIAFVAITVFAKKSLVFLLLMSLLLGIAEWYESKNNPKKAAPEPAPEPEGIETAIDKDLVQYGEPDDIIVTDPTRGSEPDGVILVYDAKGFLYYNGTVINKNEIRDITFHNVAIPYFVPDYQIVIATTSETHPNVNIKVGSDLEIVNDVLAQINGHLEGK